MNNQKAERRKDRRRLKGPNRRKKPSQLAGGTTDRWINQQPNGTTVQPTSSEEFFSSPADHLTIRRQVNTTTKSLPSTPQLPLHRSKQPAVVNKMMMEPQPTTVNRTRSTSRRQGQSKIERLLNFVGLGTCVFGAGANVTNGTMNRPVGAGRPVVGQDDTNDQGPTETVFSSSFVRSSFRPFTGDPRAGEMTMSENQRVELMNLVKSGQLSLDEAMAYVRNYERSQPNGRLVDGLRTSRPSTGLSSRLTATPVGAGVGAGAGGGLVGVPLAAQKTCLGRGRDHQMATTGFAYPIYNGMMATASTTPTPTPMGVVQWPVNGTAWRQAVPTPCYPLQFVSHRPPVIAGRAYLPQQHGPVPPSYVNNYVNGYDVGRAGTSAALVSSRSHDGLRSVMEPSASASVSYHRIMRQPVAKGIDVSASDEAQSTRSSRSTASSVRSSPEGDEAVPRTGSRPVRLIDKPATSTVKTNKCPSSSSSNGRSSTVGARSAQLASHVVTPRLARKFNSPARQQLVASPSDLDGLLQQINLSHLKPILISLNITDLNSLLHLDSARQAELNKTISQSEDRGKLQAAIALLPHLTVPPSPAVATVTATMAAVDPNGLQPQPFVSPADSGCSLGGGQAASSGSQTTMGSSRTTAVALLSSVQQPASHHQQQHHHHHHHHHHYQRMPTLGVRQAVRQNRFVVDGGYDENLAGCPAPSNYQFLSDVQSTTTKTMTTTTTTTTGGHGVDVGGNVGGPAANYQNYPLIDPVMSGSCLSRSFPDLISTSPGDDGLTDFENRENVELQHSFSLSNSVTASELAAWKELNIPPPRSSPLPVGTPTSGGSPRLLPSQSLLRVANRLEMETSKAFQSRSSSNLSLDQALDGRSRPGNLRFTSEMSLSDSAHLQLSHDLPDNSSSPYEEPVDDVIADVSRRSYGKLVPAATPTRRRNNSVPTELSRAQTQSRNSLPDLVRDGMAEDPTVTMTTTTTTATATTSTTVPTMDGSRSEVDGHGRGQVPSDFERVGSVEALLSATLDEYPVRFDEPPHTDSDGFCQMAPLFCHKLAYHLNVPVDRLALAMERVRVWQCTANGRQPIPNRGFADKCYRDPVEILLTIDFNGLANWQQRVVQLGVDWTPASTGQLHEFNGITDWPSLVGRLLEKGHSWTLVDLNWLRFLHGRFRHPSIH